ncbi:MAG: transcription antitermination factor NusB [Clostridiales bacterium]|nr:transcription antitermination factor NusB [Clostridiales bacterium]
MSRRTARKGVFRALFSKIFLEEPEFIKSMDLAFSEDAVIWFEENENEESLLNDLSERDRIFFTELIKGTMDNLDRINEVIEENLKSWNIKRIAKTDLAILQLAVYEILYREDIPDSVVINEAVDLGKEHGTDDSGSFINGVLGRIVREYKQGS